MSVVVPTRNAGPALRELLDALAAQTLPRRRFEIVIGDDGSTDGSTDGLATADGWIRVSAGPPLGSYAARNRAARLARAPVLAFCDADCRPEPDWLAEGLAALAEAPIAGGAIRFLLPAQPTVWTLLTLDMFLDHEEELTRGRGLGGNLFVQRTTFEQLGGFDESLPSGGDGDLVARALESGAEVTFARAAVVWHPTHDSAQAFLRRIWFQSRWRSVRLLQAGVRPYGLRLRWWIPGVSKARERRRTGRPLTLDRDRLSAAGVAVRRRHDLKALPILYIVIPYVAAAAQLWGWWRSRSEQHLGRAKPAARRETRPDSRPIHVTMFPRRLDNPYLTLLARELQSQGLEVSWGERFDFGWLRAARRHVDVVHFHWPEPYYLYGGRARKAPSALSWVTAGLFCVRLAGARALGYRIAWTVHQVYPHEGSRRLVHRIAAFALSRAAQLLLVHDQTTADLARNELGPAVRGKTALVRHGSYHGVYAPGRPRQEARKDLGIPDDAFVFLSFGALRAYKGLDLLLEAFESLESKNVVLLIAGAPKDDVTVATVRAAARRDGRIRPLVRFVSDSDVAELFDASDVAVFARSDGGTSGALILALSMGIAVIAARKPAYEELVEADAAGWLYREDDPASLRDCLAEASGDQAAVRARSAAASGVAGRLSWDELGEQTAAAIRALGVRQYGRRKRTTAHRLAPGG